MANIPIVDFDAYSNPDCLHDRVAVAKDIDHAFRSQGFVYLKNHGVSKERVERCFAWSKRFFALPLETKNLAPHPPGGAHHRGYSAPGLEKVSQHQFDANELSKAREVPDYKESFESGNVEDDIQPNIWPPESALPGFRAFMESFFTDCEGLVHRVLDALGVALSVEDSLSNTHSRSLFQLRLLHYPRIAVEELQRGRRSRINAHSDFGTLTLLFQDSVGGLKSKTRISHAFLGQYSPWRAQCCNDRWKSTVHRVVSPAAQDGGVVPDRYSIPFFATADPDTLIEALPGCWGESHSKKYESVTAWEYVRMRMAALYEEKEEKEKKTYGQ